MHGHNTRERYTYDTDMELRHKPVLITLNVLALVSFIIVAAFNSLAAVSNTGIFLNSTAEISDKYYLEVTPAGLTFSIWGLIYAWQAAWLIYSLTLVCRTGPHGPIYINPVLLCPSFFAIYILNLLINVAWLILFDRQLLEAAFVFLAFIALTLYVCIFLSYRRLENKKEDLVKENRMIDDILVRVFVHNGIGIYAAWTTIATFLNMGFVIAYRSSTYIPQSTASIVSVSFVAAALVLFVATDLTIFDKYSRYTITPYGVIIWALTGVLLKNYDPSKATTIMSLVLISVAVLSLLVLLQFILNCNLIFYFLFLSGTRFICKRVIFLDSIIWIFAVTQPRTC